MKPCKKDDDVQWLYAFADERGRFTFGDVALERARQELRPWHRAYYFLVVRRVRAIFSQEKRNLVCYSQGTRDYWLYELTDQSAPGERWSQWRFLVAEKALETLHNVCLSFIAAKHPNSHDGKRWRYVDRTVMRLREDLRDLLSDAG